MWQFLKYLLGQIGQKGVKQLQSLFQQIHEQGANTFLFKIIAAVEAEFGNLNVPVAIFAPEKLMDGAAGIVEAIGFKGAMDPFRGPVKTVEYPAVSCL